MKERPILFGGPMVRSILDGRKTQTRRVAVNRVDPDIGCDLTPGEISLSRQDVIDRCSPYGQPGDRLWVKETFYDEVHGDEHFVAYRATNAFGDGNVKWKPSIYMPRWASRITLEVVSVRVQRVQHISEKDARKEGVTWRPCEDFVSAVIPGPYGKLSGPGRIAFMELWDSINSKRGFAWQTNPWVWAIEFKLATNK